jgi:hypothetical protein
VTALQALGAKGGAQGFARSLFLPFVRTPYNLAAQGAAMSPLGLAGTVSSIREARGAAKLLRELPESEVAARQVAQATLDRASGQTADRATRTLFGTGALVLADQLAEHGYLTAAMPDDARERSMLPPGWQPWSLRVPTADGGGTYVSFKNLGPLAYPLAMGAAIGEMRKRGKPPDVGTVIKGTANFFVDQSFLQGMDRMLDAITQPERYGEAFLESLVAPVAPASALTRQLDQAIGMANRDPDNALQAFVAALAPGTAAFVPERQNALGEPVQPGQTGIGRMISPVGYDIERDTPVLQALREANVGIPAPAKSITVRDGRIDLNETEQRILQRHAGEYIKDYVNKSIEGPGFQKFSREGRQRTLQALVEDATDRARRDFVSALPKEDYARRAAEGKAAALREREGYQIGPVTVPRPGG